MRRKFFATSLIGMAVAAGVSACSAITPQPTAVPPQVSAPAPTTAAPAPTAAPAAAPPAPVALPVAGAGVVRAARDADLIFQVPGTVAQVFVEEGMQVNEGDVLAVLDVRSLDLDIKRAEAALAAAMAQEGALSEGARRADIAAANAQVRQAEANLALARSGPETPDVENANASVAAAEANLQATRDRLSAAKTNAELQLEQAANQLRNAQDQYSRVYWDNRQLEKLPGDLPQAAKDAEAAALRAVQNAETAMEQARLGLEQAQQAEVTGIQAAEQQLKQAQAGRDRVLLPPDEDRVAAAEAQLAAARAQRARLNPDPQESQKNQVAASIQQAEVAVEIAKINREKAELRAPFAGIISIVNIDPGDPSSTGGQPAIQIVDANKLRVEVQISDTDIARVRVGQKAVVKVDALPNKSYSGKVSFIAPTATSIGSVRTYLVRIELDSQENLRDGMSTRVDIMTS